MVRYGRRCSSWRISCRSSCSRSPMSSRCSPRMEGLMPPHLIDWAFVAALVTSAITIGTKWLLPALQKIGRGEDESAEWRGRVGAQLDQQDKALTALMEA